MAVYYSTDHEWLSVEGDEATLGITDYAQTQLGDVVFVELPEIGRELAKGDEVAVVESVKTASEIYAVVSGEITAVNQDLVEAPQKINEDAEASAWIFKLKISNRSELEALMDRAAYESHLSTL